MLKKDTRRRRNKETQIQDIKHQTPNIIEAKRPKLVLYNYDGGE